MKKAAAATIGFFDGVHRGHLFLVEQLCREASVRGLRPVVITFDRHPRQVLCDSWQPQLLTTLSEKERLLRQTGIDRLVVLHFDEELSRLSASDFMQHVLKEQLGVQMLLTGYDNHFGHRTKGTDEGFDDYVRYGQTMGIDVVEAQPLMLEGQAVSSSRIRRLLTQGEVEQAARCLGRPYELCGEVVEGEQVGRQIGFPTANLQLQSSCLLMPEDGVYAVRVNLMDDDRQRMGVTNIGMRPTFDGHRHTIETHILDFHRSIYRQPMTIRFVARLRSEQHFDSAETLARQMAADVQRAKEILQSQNPSLNS